MDGWDESIPEDFDAPIYADGKLIGWYTPGVTCPTPDSLPVVGGVIAHPRGYMTRCGPRQMPEDPTWPNPRWASVSGSGGIWYENTLPWRDGSTRWGMSGWTIHPRTRLGLFVARIVEGRYVRYPWRHVLWFAWRSRKWSPKAP